MDLGVPLLRSRWMTWSVVVVLQVSNKGYHLYLYILPAVLVVTQCLSWQFGNYSKFFKLCQEPMRGTVLTISKTPTWKPMWTSATLTTVLLCRTSLLWILLLLLVQPALQLILTALLGIKQDPGTKSSITWINQPIPHHQMRQRIAGDTPCRLVQRTDFVFLLPASYLMYGFKCIFWTLLNSTFNRHQRF